jgi:CheY-like chemotaxis protein
VLEDGGYKVVAATDGEDAVKKFVENRDSIRLLLLDLVMPKKGGKEACDEIRRLKPGISVIFLSGYAPEMARQRASLEYDAPLIMKPISPGDLLQKVRSVLDERNRPGKAVNRG